MAFHLRIRPRRAAAFLLAAASLAATLTAQARTSLLADHLPPWTADSPALELAPPALPFDHVTLMLTGSAAQEQALRQLLRAQQTPGDPDFHHWLSPVEIGQRFGVSPADLSALVRWLRVQGLQVDPISRTRRFLTVSGTAAQLETAFDITLRYFQVGADKRLAPDREPSLPASLAPKVSAILGLTTQHDQPGLEPGLPPARLCLTCPNTLGPRDFATIYDLPPATAVSGAGRTIAIAGRARAYPPDLADFGAAFNLPLVAPTVTVPPDGIDPGPPLSAPENTPLLGLQREATLDLTRAGSIAPGAALELIASADGPSGTAPGMVTDIEYVIENEDKLQADILSISFIVCESDLPASTIAAYDQMFGLAAAEGVSVFVCAGDSGAATCDPHGNSVPPPAAAGAAVINGYCSSGNVTCVGGTEFAADQADPSAYWNDGTAQQYIPEGAWNDSSASQVDSGGGGVSRVIPAPDWQSGPGVPLPPAGRYVPDLALSASGTHDPYLFCMAALGTDCHRAFTTDGGTSASAPSVAGIMALVDNASGGRQGNANPTLYRIAQGPHASLVFHDVTVASSGVANCDLSQPSLCNNSIPPLASGTGTLGYSVQPGFDLVTGWGSVDAARLIASWPTSAVYAPAVTLQAASTSAFPAQPMTFTVSVNGGEGVPTGSVQLFTGGRALGNAASLAAGVATITGVTLASPGVYPVTAQYSGDAKYTPLASASLSMTIADYSMTPGQSTLTVDAASQSGAGTLMVTPLGDFNAAIGFACAGLPAYSSCRFMPSSVTPGDSPVAVQIKVLTAAAPSPSASGPGGRPTGAGVAVVALMLLLFAWCSGRRRAPRTAMLALAALIAGGLMENACGGCQCTPAGTFPITVTATTTGTPADVHTATIQLVVP